MNKPLLVVMVGLALLCAPQAWAGGGGNGAAQRRAAAGLPPLEAKAQYTFCYGGSPETVYFSPVLVRGAATTGVRYGRYLTQTYGSGSNDGGQCVSSTARADVVSAKRKQEQILGAKREVIETDWTGAS